MEFWVTYDATEILPILAEADQLIKQTSTSTTAAATEATDLASEAAGAAEEGQTSVYSREENPLFALLDPSFAGNCVVGTAVTADMPAINEY